MPTTRSSSAPTSKRLRQSRIDFSKAPASSPPSKRSARAQATAALTVSSSQPTTTRSLRTRTRTGADAHFLGTSTRKRQTYLVQSSDDDDSDVVLPSSRPRVESSHALGDSENLMGTQFGRAQQGFVFDETASESEEEEEEEEDGAPLLRVTGARKRKRGAAVFVVDDDASEEDGDEGSAEEAVTPRRTTRRASERDEEDLADDLEFLRSSPPAITPRNGTSKRDARTKALENLRRQREKRKPAAHSSQDRKRQKMVVLDSEDEISIKSSSDNGLETGDSDDDADEAEELESNQEEDDFIIEDDQVDGEAEIDYLGVPTPSIPIALTHWATAKPKDLFKFGVEWFVQKKINPAFDRDDEIYTLTWQKLNDEITGLVGSKFTSSAWNRDFTYALQSRPLMTCTRVDAIIMQDCEACNRSGHPATWRVQFTGAPYDPHTYEDVEQDPDEQRTDDGITRDWRGHRVPPERREYFMGATCFKNASVAHRLRHWRYSLGGWVLAYLESVGELVPARIVARDAWSERRRREHACEIVRRMEEEGEVAGLYRTMKGEVNDARGAADWG